ncbi:nucleoside-binding protein [Pseudooceanicola nitratireducens]|jgi:simple sugar transport system substrate-binding protein|uniref:Nucleoside-binding protein n=2 Tax=Pseudooceanicola nitratireducens TaxID=517719 RepID=A0A1I1QSK3_9RHOB|nr:simple sugar transport system substrate-binding protein [Pseudooceanicola nitratireducens]SFD25015.1 nucleoside-binding protein [Pseudooceanicola nitratireducens]
MFKIVRAPLIGAALALSWAGALHAQDPLEISILAPNAIGDVGWDHEIYRGKEVLEKRFGDKVKVAVVDSVGEGPNATRAMNRLVANGTDVLILGGFGHMSDGLTLAKRSPDLKVLHIGGYQNLPNFATFTVRHYQASYLCGMAAGYATQNGQLGVVAAFPLPEVLGILNAYVLGAQSVNPDLKPVKVVWLNAWYDPPRDRAAAESLISQGSDVVYSLFPGTPSAVATAEEKGVYAVTTLSDNSAHAPTKHLCAGQADFGVVYGNVVQSVFDENFEGKDTFAGVTEGAMQVAGLSKDLTDEQRAAIMAKQEEMRAGTFEPFTGPVTNNTGSEAIAAEKVLSSAEIKSMDFLVDGIDAQLNK